MSDQVTSSTPEHDTPSRSCPIDQIHRGVCGRPVHDAREHDNPTPCCILHSLDPDKNDAEFQTELGSITEQAALNGETADLTHLVFTSANFHGRVFGSQCDFRYATFLGSARFDFARFTQPVDFSWATFLESADFGWSEFSGDATFYRSQFKKKAAFNHCAFAGVAKFSLAEFTRAYFDSCTFTKDAFFAMSIFQEFADFQSADFMSAADFDRTAFEQDGDSLIGAAFCQARFFHPDMVIFRKTWLGNTILVNTDVTKVTFSAVQWRRRPDNKRRLLFEERVKLSKAPPLAPAEGSFDERNFLLIAELYQQLKKSYDDRKDYSTAGDFHYGEMEMKRLHSDNSNALVRFFHRNLGLIALYRYASSYGESYLRPLACFLVVVVVFTLAFPLPGLVDGTPAISSQGAVSCLAPTIQTNDLSYRNFHRFVDKQGVAAFSGIA